MKFKKILLTAFCFLLLTLWAIHIFIITDDGTSTLAFRLLVTSAIVFIPLIVGLIASLFKRKLFHVSIWTSTALVFVFFAYIVYFLADNNENYYPKEFKAVQKHFRKKAGFFTNYLPLVLTNEGFQKGKTANEHVVKHLYRLGRRHLENYYIGKVLVDSNFTVIQEFYNIRAIDDTSLLRREFQKVLLDLTEIKKMIDYD